MIRREEVEERIEKKNYKFLHYLRVLAMAMIFFDHLGLFRNPQWFLGGILDKLFCRPLNIIQYFGALGVVLFFLISGFLFVNSLQNSENKKRFFIKKFIKIYIPCVGSYIIFFIFQNIIAYFQGEGYWKQFDFKQWIEGATLFAYISGSADVINGTTWYLVPLLIFYVIGTFVLTKNNPIKSKAPILKILSLDAILLLVYFIGISFSNIKILYFTTKMSWYIAFIVFGVLIYYIYNNFISLKSFLCLCFINYIVAIIGVYLFSYDNYENFPYMVSMVYAIGIFCIGIFMENKLKHNKYIEFLSEISYHIYLLHMPFGSLLLSIIETKMRFTYAFFISVLFVSIAGWLYYMILKKAMKKIEKVLDKKV